jgi:hypothetical protein
MSSEPDAFDNADFYTCSDTNRVTLESPEEAIRELLDLHMVPGRNEINVIRDHTPITVFAFKRGQVSDMWIESTAEWLLDQAAEWFSDEYGDPDGSNQDIDDDTIKHVMPAMKAAVKQLVECGTVWNCEHVVSRNFDADQVIVMMFERYPEWFTKNDHDERDQVSR